MTTQQPTICRCQMCSAEIEFESSRAGENIICPICAQETVLYLPGSEAPPQSAPPPVEEKKYTRYKTADGEMVFLHEGEIYVSNARFVANGKTYPLNGITSVQAVKQKRKDGTAWILILLGVILLGATATFGVGMIVVGILILFLQKTTYSVDITTAAGEASAYKNQDKESINKIVRALNEAIVARG